MKDQIIFKVPLLNPCCPASGRADSRHEAPSGLGVNPCLGRIFAIAMGLMCTNFDKLFIFHRDSTYTDEGDAHAESETHHTV